MKRDSVLDTPALKVLASNAQDRQLKGICDKEGYEVVTIAQLVDATVNIWIEILKESNWDQKQQKDKPFILDSRISKTNRTPSKDEVKEVSINKLGSIITTYYTAKEEELAKFKEYFEYKCYTLASANKDLEFSVKSNTSCAIDNAIYESLIYAGLPLNVLPRNLTTKTYPNKVSDNLSLTADQLYSTEINLDEQIMFLQINTKTSNEQLEYQCFGKNIPIVTIEQLADSTINYWVTQINDTATKVKEENLSDEHPVNEEQIAAFKKFFKFKIYQKISNLKSFDLNFSIQSNGICIIDNAILESLLYSKIPLNCFPRNLLTKTTLEGVEGTLNGVKQEIVKHNLNPEQNKSR